MKHNPTLYEPKSMFCEIASVVGSSVVGSLIGAGASLIGGSMASDAAEDASDAQVRAAEIAAGVQREGLAFSKEAFDIGRADLAPWRASGTSALGVMNDLFIPGGEGVVQLQGQLNDLRAQRAVLARGGEQSTPVQPAGAASAPASAPASGSFLNNFETAYRRQFTGEASDPLGIL
jgi:hypothetical protein